MPITPCRAGLGYPITSSSIGLRVRTGGGVIGWTLTYKLDGVRHRYTDGDLREGGCSAHLEEVRNCPCIGWELSSVGECRCRYDDGLHGKVKSMSHLCAEGLQR